MNQSVYVTLRENDLSLLACLNDLKLGGNTDFKKGSLKIYSINLLSDLMELRVQAILEKISE